MTAVVALGVLTTSLKLTATQLLHVGTADFTVAQKHTDDLINSTISEEDMAAMRRKCRASNRARRRAALDRLATTPTTRCVIEVGLDPAEQAPFGVDILDGRSYDRRRAATR